MPPLPLAHVGLDECGSLPDETAWFVLAGVLTDRPESVRYIVRRIARRSGRRLKRHRHAISEFKWSNAGRRFRTEVLQRLAGTPAIEIVTLAVEKSGRRIEDTPENYACLVCELLRLCWSKHPNLALAFDRRFTAPSQVAVLNTFVYRHWPAPGVLSITHVDSQRNSLVQLADFVAGSVYDWHKSGDEVVKLLGGKIAAASVVAWPEVRRRWIAEEK